MFATPVYTIMEVALFFAGAGVCRDTVEEAPFARDYHPSQKNHGPVEILVYHWGGGHDFLYFVAVDEMLADSGWWHAGE
jgi:hypothetical protein